MGSHGLSSSAPRTYRYKRPAPNRSKPWYGPDGVKILWTAVSKITARRHGYHGTGGPDIGSQSGLYTVLAAVQPLRAPICPAPTRAVTA
eukprot:CAMPEP_0204363742 /NCGR_PEP_ID=MMETSP0469-20131031/40602_1 /ASSEMBLY_ACC=CAM_ASM_000384 /TAXON_ID=2969 /ORGANISM="Oxyrrhis marina" /LENGTH=88 /DNA_ID=CAMNT_0051352529 /DNA_START=43 /DNA_END=306 /DNA_ORIENTATION=+